MFLRIVSDLHLELYPKNFFLPTQNDQKQILILAGDTSTVTSSANNSRYIRSLQRRLDDLKTTFDKIIFVCGNHEFYETDVEDVKQTLHDYFNDTQVHFLDNTSILIDDVLFIGCTLWSNFQSCNTTLMNLARTSLNDFKKITLFDANGQKQRLQPENTLQWHNKSVEFITNTLELWKGKVKKFVIVTHYAPSWQSISEQYKPFKINGCYVSELRHLILKYQPNLWVHGHTHDSMDYYINKTRVVCNPKGYPHKLNPDFNPLFVVEI